MEKEKSTFEDLEVWQKGRALRNGISNLTKTFPEEEKYKLANQMIRASRSVTANISEGYGRFHFQENIQFCRQARGSLFELIDHLTVALVNDLTIQPITIGNHDSTTQRLNDSTYFPWTLDVGPWTYVPIPHITLILK
jgi:four helix bundle protein